MSTDMDLSSIWPEWKIEKKIGRGSNGIVYKAVRSYRDVESSAAVKVISIPRDESELDSLRYEGMGEEGTRSYLQQVVDDLVGEIKMMESLKGTANIVNVEDFTVIESKEGPHWDIYIRMELLTPLNSYLCDRKMSEDEVLKLAYDICNALKVCEKKKIVHRDIKPENIFVNDMGDFKLGDFGIARKLENMTFGLSQKGTFNYMAPEVASSSFYDSTVDIYSLGIVLYRLMNANRLPFLDSKKQLLTPDDRRSAVERRLRGEEFPKPGEASGEFSEIILKACSFDPKKRYRCASDMKDDIEKLMAQRNKAAAETDRTNAEISEKAQADETSPEKGLLWPHSTGEGSGTLWQYVLIFAGVLFIGFCIFMFSAGYYNNNRAENFVMTEEYEKAKEIYLSSGFILNSAKKYDNVLIYEKAMEAMRDQDYYDAKTLFHSLGKFADAERKEELVDNLMKISDRVYQVNNIYDQPMGTPGDDIQQCPEYIEDEDYRHAFNLMQEGFYQEAYEEFLKLDGRYDSAYKAMECAFRYASECMLNGYTSMAGEYFKKVIDDGSFWLSYAFTKEELFNMNYSAGVGDDRVLATKRSIGYWNNRGPALTLCYTDDDDQYDYFFYRFEDRQGNLVGFFTFDRNGVFAGKDDNW